MYSISLAKKTYIIFAFLLTVAVLVFGFINARNTRTVVEAATRQTLFEIVSMLQQRLPNDYDELLAEQGYQNLSMNEKVIALRRILQPIVEDLTDRYPAYAMGYGTYNQHVAGYPNPDGLTAEIAKTVYKTGSILIYTATDSPAWNYATSIGLVYPLCLNGQVYGHIWANTNLENIMQVFWQFWGRNIALIFIAWLGLLLTTKLVFLRMNKGLKRLAVQIDQGEKPADMQDFPELTLVLETVTVLRHGWQQEKQRVLDILNSISDRFYALDRDLRLTYMNPKAKECSLLTDKHTGQFFFDVFPAEREGELLKAMLSAVAENRRIELNTRSSIYAPDRWFDIFIYPAAGGITLLLTDVTERKRMQDAQQEITKHLARLEELNVVSKIAAAISHEIRNPLTTVRGYLQYLSTKKDYTAHQSYFDLMIEELDRANSIISEFLSVARPQPDDKQDMSINDILLTVRPLLETDALKAGHEIKFLLGELPSLRLSSNKIRQLILNLTRNAFEAMDNHGAVAISTYTEREYVVLAIRDNGPGIAQTVLDNLGTPFTTTKPNGTGLGLSVCYSIVEQHSGNIDVETNRQGTTFYIRFTFAEK